MTTGRYIWLNRWKNDDKNISIFASWTKEGWWSWARKVIEQVLEWKTDISNILLVSNHQDGWVSKIMWEYKHELQSLWIGLYFKHLGEFPNRDSSWEYSTESILKIKEAYETIFKQHNLKYIFLSGWMKLILWINPEQCINIHPGPTQKPYGWKGMHGINVHEKIWEDYNAWKIKQTCITIHYVTEKFDEWPIIAQIPVDISTCENPEDVRKAVNKVEHKWQPLITEMIINWEISWSWKTWDFVKTPQRFEHKWEVNLQRWFHDSFF